MFYILSVSDSDKHFCSAIQEYEKRLWKDLKIENLKPYKDDNQSFVIEKETTNIIETINKKYKNYQKILLIKEGQSLDTFWFASLIKGKDSVFIIWGPYWVNEQRLKSEYSDLKETSFWAITLPHWLAKLTLIEQIYRATTLWTGKKYHY
jgi:23S rRNA (pseudouridine1915-N3)-methyltransferase